MKIGEVWINKTTKHKVKITDVYEDWFCGSNFDDAICIDFNYITGKHLHEKFSSYSINWFIKHFKKVY